LSGQTRENDLSSLNEVVFMVSLGTRVAGTVAVVFGWLAFVVLYLAFFADGFDFWQKTAVFIASGAIVLGAITLMWIRYVLD
jgi:hypothetical protein